MTKKYSDEMNDNVGGSLYDMLKQLPDDNQSDNQQGGGLLGNILGSLLGMK